MESLDLLSGVGCMSYKNACSRQDRSPCPGALQVQRKPNMLRWKERGDSCSLELYVPPLPHIFVPQKGPYPFVPTHKEFLRHCWAHHDNWVLNKAFLLGILPFTGERRGGQQSKEGETERKRREEGWGVKREGGGA